MKKTEEKLTLPAIKYCSTMPELRECIDSLDKRITDLIAERTFYIAQAARIKTNINTVRDEARIEDVINKVIARAKDYKIPMEVLEITYRTMMEACIAFEHHEFIRLRNSSPV